MKSGSYKVTFEVVLNDCEDNMEATEEVMKMISHTLDDGELLEMNFSFIEGSEMDYSLEEEALELNFEETI